MDVSGLGTVAQYLKGRSSNILSHKVKHLYCLCGCGYVCVSGGAVCLPETISCCARMRECVTGPHPAVDPRVKKESNFLAAERLGVN